MGKHFANGPSAEHQATAAHSFAQAPEPARPYGAYSRAPRASYQGSGFDDSNFGKPKKKHTAAKVILVIVLLLVVVAGVEGFLLFNSVKTIKNDANVAIGSVDSLKTAAKSGDAAALSRVSSDINVSAHNIQNELASPAWTFASLVPVLGDDVRSVRALGDVMVDLSDNALTPLASNSDAVKLSNLMSAGAVNVPVFEQLASALQQAAPVIQRSDATLKALPEAHIPQVKDVMGNVTGKISTASDAVTKLNLIAPHLPKMLGGNGQTRNYLLVAQNNAEARSTGGFYGSWSVLTVTDGKIELGGSQKIQNTEITEDIMPSVTDAEITVFGDHIRTNPGSTGYLYDFSRAGDVAAQYWEGLTGQAIDGTIAVDPVFLQTLLRLAGGFTTSDGTVVDGTNAATALLHDSYWSMEPEQTDIFFAEVAARSFAQLMGNLGGVDMSGLLEEVQKSAEEGRVQVWMKEAAEERAITELDLSGNFASDEKDPVAGVYFNDQTFSKIEWYLKVDNSIGAATQNADGTTSYQVTTSFTNMLDPQTAKIAPEYVLGHNDQFDKTSMVEGVYLTPPGGGKLSNISVSDGSEVTDFTHTGLNVWGTRITIPMEDTVTISYTVTVSSAATSPLKVHASPTAQVAAGW